MPDSPSICAVTAQLIWQVRLDEVPAVAELLGALEASELLCPARWGTRESMRAPYSRDAVLRHTAEASADEKFAHVRATAPLGFRAVWEAAASEHRVSSFIVENLVDLTRTDAGALFEAITELAPLFPLEFGSIDVRFHGQDPQAFLYSGTSVHPLDEYIAKGPRALYARTLLGPRVVGLIGGTGVLDHCGGEVTTLEAATAAVLDLVAKPWAADPDVLKRKQAEVDRRLRLSGIVAGADGRWRTAPGGRWEAPPLEDSGSGSERLD